MIDNNIQKNTCGFTLLEMLIVISIIGIVIPMMMGLFIVNLRSYVRVKTLAEVKKNGDFALDNIEAKIRDNIWAIYSNESGTSEICTTKSSLLTQNYYTTETGEMYFKKSDGVIFSLSINNNRLVYSQSSNDYDITSDNVIVDFLRLSCNRSSEFSSPIVTVEFTVESKQQSRAEDALSLNYYSKYKIR